MTIEKRLSLTITTLAVLSVLLAAAGGIPTLLSIRSIRDKMVEENQKIEKAYALRRLSGSTSDVIQNAHQRLADMGPLTIVEGDELTFISDLENAATSADITQELQLETVNQKDLSPWEREIPLKITAGGDFRQVVIYLHKLEALPFYMTTRILRISVPKQREKASEGLVEAYLESAVRWRSKDHPVFKKVEYPTDGIEQ